MCVLFEKKLCCKNDAIRRVSWLYRPFSRLRGSCSQGECGKRSSAFALQAFAWMVTLVTQDGLTRDEIRRSMQRSPAHGLSIDAEVRHPRWLDIKLGIDDPSANQTHVTSWNSICIPHVCGWRLSIPIPSADNAAEIRHGGPHEGMGRISLRKWSNGICKLATRRHSQITWSAWRWKLSAALWAMGCFLHGALRARNRGLLQALAIYHRDLGAAWLRCTSCLNFANPFGRDLKKSRSVRPGFVCSSPLHGRPSSWMARSTRSFGPDSLIIQRATDNGTKREGCCRIPKAVAMATVAGSTVAVAPISVIVATLVPATVRPPSRTVMSSLRHIPVNLSRPIAMVTRPFLRIGEGGCEHCGSHGDDEYLLHWLFPCYSQGNLSNCKVNRKWTLNPKT